MISEESVFGFQGQSTPSHVYYRNARHLKSGDADHVSSITCFPTGFNTFQDGIQCPYCPVVLSSRSHANLHITSAHSDKISRFPFHCETCGKGFFSKSGLRHHAETHFVKSECFVCKRTFMYSRNLKRHLEMSHGLRECRTCKQYISAIDFGAHLQGCTSE